jgi:hypothetical protein
MYQMAKKAAKSMGEILPKKDASADYADIKKNLSNI